MPHLSAEFVIFVIGVLKFDAAEVSCHGRQSHGEERFAHVFRGLREEEAAKFCAFGGIGHRRGFLIENVVIHVFRKIKKG